VKPTVGIVGTGTIGGSIGMRARREGALVVGCDADAGALARAIEAGAIDLAAARDELYARADTVAIAVHLDATVEELERLRSAGSIRATLIVDVASVKAPVVAAAAGVSNFVATHPMAGSERSGMGAARPELFDGRTWAYVPSGNHRLDAQACAFVASMGAVPLAVDAREHDRVVAFTSHATQVLAWQFTRQARICDPELLYALSGTTARELLRLGDSQVTMWRDILRANAENVEPELRSLALKLSEAADALRAGNFSFFAQ